MKQGLLRKTDYVLLKMLRAIPIRIHTVLEIWKSTEDNKNNLPSVCEDKNYGRCITHPVIVQRNMMIYKMLRNVYKQTNKCCPKCNSNIAHDCVLTFLNMSYLAKFYNMFFIIVSKRFISRIKIWPVRYNSFREKISLKDSL
jgi:hypothetical protein